MTPLTNTANPEQRILEAATTLFAQLGFNGASTREIARLAAVNDATVYRHFPSKKDLFLAVLERELQKLRIPSDLLLRVANSRDARAAVASTFELLTDVFARQPDLVRLLQFGVLEFGSVLQPVYQRHLGQLLEEMAAYLSSWQQRGGLCCKDPQATVTAFAVAAVGMQTMYPTFVGEQLSPELVRDGAAECAGLWHSLLEVTDGP